MKNKIFWLLLSALWLASCSDSKSPQWIFKGQIQLNDIAPVGIDSDGTNLWLSDPDNNRVVKTDLQGNIVKEIANLQRPMHIAFSEGKLFVPEYLTDTIPIIESNKQFFLPISSKLNAPAGIAVQGNTIAIADFYNHRVILKEGDKEISIGKERHNPGELYYPTDVAIHQEKIYVADAYNNRVQVFDKQGNSLQVIGANDNIRVATGVAIGNEQLFVTDFERNKVLIYGLDGKLLQVLDEHFNKPADLCVLANQLYVANYFKRVITIFGKK